LRVNFVHLESISSRPPQSNLQPQNLRRHSEGFVFLGELIFVRVNHSVSATRRIAKAAWLYPKKPNKKDAARPSVARLGKQGKRRKRRVFTASEGTF
jgi:hypothetical protein